jgi:hypothetical protein
MFGSIIVILTAKIKDKWNDPTVKSLIKLFPNLMAATVSLGVAPLLFVQLVYSKQIYAASIVSGWFWLMIFMVAMISYYLLYSASFSKLPGKGNRFVYLVLASVGFFYISFVYSSVFSMAELPDQIQKLYASNQSGFVINTNIGNYIFRWLHIILGTITVGAFFVSWVGKNNDNIFKAVNKFFIFGMVITMFFGFMRMMTLGDVMKPFMKSPAIWLVTAGFFLSLASMYYYNNKKYVITAVLLFVSMLTMVATRHIVRLLFLEGSFDPASLTVKPEWTIFLIFLGCFVAALLTIWYMFRLFFTKQQT